MRKEKLLFCWVKFKLMVNLSGRHTGDGLGTVNPAHLDVADRHKEYFLFAASLDFDSFGLLFSRYVFKILSADIILNNLVFHVIKK